MTQIKIYHIFNTITKKSDYSDTYDICLHLFNQSTKIYRKTHKIISDKDYQKIIKKKPNQ